MIRSLNMGITRQPYSDLTEPGRRRDERLDNPREPGPESPQPPAKLHSREQPLYAPVGEAGHPFNRTLRLILRRPSFDSWPPSATQPDRPHPAQQTPTSAARPASPGANEPGISITEPINLCA